MTAHALATDAPPRRDLLRAVAAGTANVTGTAFLRSLARHLAEALDADVAFVSELTQPPWERGRILACWSRIGHAPPEGHEYAIAGRPCELVADRDLVAVAEGVAKAFATDRYVTALGVEGYLAVVMHGSDGRRLGYIGVMSRRRLDASDDERAALSVFASRAGAEIERRRHEAALRERDAAVAASRARLVQAADEERRRIGRDLHDGVQQRLVALVHRIEVARRKLDSAPPAADEMLAAAADEARSAGQELRELARGLHPAGLSEYGLEPALRALAGRASLAVEIERLPDRRLPEVIEVTVFYLVSEAITNAAKHAGAASLRVSVTTGPAALVAEIADDGVGGADADGEGSGLRGLRDRVATLGGTLTVDSPPGAGTRLEARIPLAPWRSAREPFLEVGHPDDGGEGERTIADIEAGRKRVSVTLAREWELEGGLPRIGRRMPVIDHHGVRRATVEIERVALVPFADVGPDVVPLEATGAVSHEAWRERQKAFYDRCREEVAVLLEEPGWWLTDEEPMAVVWFRAVDEQPPA